MLRRKTLLTDSSEPKQELSCLSTRPSRRGHTSPSGSLKASVNEVVQQVTIRSDLLSYHGAILSDRQQCRMMFEFIDWNRAIIKSLSTKDPGPYHFDRRLGQVDTY